MTTTALTRLALAMGLLGFTTVAFAGESVLTGRNPWKWQDTNRASIAAMIEQHKGNLGGANGAGGGCGGSAGNTLAIQNYTCIIINHSTAAITGSQTGAGNQTSTTETNATANGVPNNELSSVLQALIPQD